MITDHPRYDPPTLVTSPWCPDTDMRDAMIANARAIVGLHGGTRETYDDFQRLLGPSKEGKYGIWPLRKKYTQGGISTCAMVALGLLRRLGIVCADIQDGYHDDLGTGLDVAIELAKRQSPSAWIDACEGGQRPRPGDIVQILGPMHVLVVVDWHMLPDGTLHCVSVDGGQIGLDGLQMISVCRRPWQEPSAASRPTLAWRRVHGWIDIDRLPWGGPVTRPA